MQVFPVPLGPVTIAVSAGSPFVIGSRTLEVVDFGVAMLNFSRDEPGAKDAKHRESSVSDRMILGQIVKTSSGQFRKLLITVELPLL